MLNQEQQIFEQIKKAKNILITFNKRWEGDAIASALALFLVCKKQEKNVEIIAEKFSDSAIFNFLPAYGNIKSSLDISQDFIISLDTSHAKVGQIKYNTKENSLDFIISPKGGFFTHDDISSGSENFKYDLIIVLDTPDLESIGTVYDNNTNFFYKTPIINIDHHSNNERFGQINHVELTAISTTEILFNLISEYSQDAIDEDIATCLLTGIISKTKSFKTQNITPQSLAISSQLITIGADREKIVNRLYRSRPLNLLKLWGRILARLTSSREKALVWSILTLADFNKTEANENDLIELIDELIVSIPQANIIILIYESNLDGDKNKTQNNITKALIYSVKNINSLNLAKKFKPSGTRNFVKIQLDKPLNEAEPEIINTIKEELNKLPQ
ncbi:DHH family phosphoesterase [Candidatus Parcubacteria bacterium]|nr:DHH family phosphoesterase [Candidatus Parcubacteria bacterium]